MKILCKRGVRIRAAQGGRAQVCVGFLSTFRRPGTTPAPTCARDSCRPRRPRAPLRAAPGRAARARAHRANITKSHPQTRVEELHGSRTNYESIREILLNRIRRGSSVRRQKGGETRLAGPPRVSRRRYETLYGD